MTVRMKPEYGDDYPVSRIEMDYGTRKLLDGFHVKTVEDLRNFREYLSNNGIYCRTRSDLTKLFGKYLK